MIWFTSDLHFFHDRKFLYRPRGFTNVFDMNRTIVTNWNQMVQPEDDVYVLGDLMLNDTEQGIALLKQLKGNIHIILGNHDTNTRIDAYNRCWNVVEIGYATVLNYEGYHFYLSHYPTLINNENNKRRPLKKTMINLFGHTHQQTKYFQLEATNTTCYSMYYVGLDAHDNKPVSIEDIIQDLRTTWSTLPNTTDKEKKGENL